MLREKCMKKLIHTMANKNGGNYQANDLPKDTLKERLI